MNVGELIAELQKYNPSDEVRVQYTTSASGCCNSYPEDEEKGIDHLFESKYRDCVWEKGPRGGKEAWRTKDVDSVTIRIEY